MLGGALAALVSFYDFPGRRWLDWALVLPLAMPAYVLVFVLLGQYDAASPLQRGAARGPRRRLPAARGPLDRRRDHRPDARPLPLRLRARAQRVPRAVARHARGGADARARPRRGVLRVALPLARPALAAGAALAVMEALADFGAVNLLNYRAMTDAIYRVWYGAFDQRGGAPARDRARRPHAERCVALERLLRGRARYHGALVRGEAVVPRRLHGGRAALAAAAAVLAAARRRRRRAGGPARRLVGRSRWATARAARDLARDGAQQPAAGRRSPPSSRCRRDGRGLRPPDAAVARRRRWPRGSRRSATPCPGTVVAVAVYVPLAWLDRRLRRGGARHRLGSSPARRSGWSLAYLVRFHALALLRRRRAHGAHRPRARRRRAQPRRRPRPRARRRPPAAAVAGHRHRRAARLRRGDEGAAGDGAAAAARRRHAGRSPCGRRRRTRASTPPRCPRC